ncbi:UTP--glucose-1-phosphate uridylyltransferase [Candidatus Woesearchaeota archaeon]|nr:MAG: UTP--glucose-1-phosphate uridylyltransferase [Candidatus Woesearchaeota archaeon ex4484_78]RLE45921.1 MAG: UTP--glucose-1-phosphate uridylyltransferase [Candidatus Woesearchaeota archaeon]
MQAIIMAAGRGKRMKGLCEEIPKPIMPVNGRCILEIILKQLSLVGVKEAVIVVKYKKQKIIDKIGSERFGINIVYAEQKDIKGTGQAVLTAEPFIFDEKFYVIAGDSLFPTSVLTRLKDHPDADAVLTVCRVEDPSRFGVIETDDGRVTRIVEKSSNPPTNLANLSIYLFPKKIFDMCKRISLSPRGEYELTDAIQLLIDQGGIVEYEVIEKGLDVGTPEQLKEAQELAKELFEEI